MLNQDQLQKIAEYMGYEERIVHLTGNSSMTVTDFPDGGFITKKVDFLTDEYNHKVFKALLDECKKRDWAVDVGQGILTVGPWNETFGIVEVFEGEFNNEAICLAYLAVMDSK